MALSSWLTAWAAVMLGLSVAEALRRISGGGGGGGAGGIAGERPLRRCGQWLGEGAGMFWKRSIGTASAMIAVRCVAWGSTAATGFRGEADLVGDEANQHVWYWHAHGLVCGTQEPEHA